MSETASPGSSNGGAGFVPCRLVRHDFPLGGGHLDLFVDVDGGPELASYRIALRHSWALKSALTTGRILTAPAPTNPVGTGRDSHLDAIPCEAAPPHRRLYWEYEGPVSGERGTIVELARGLILRPAAAGAIVLLIPKKRFWSNVKGRIMAWFYGRS